MSDNGKTVQPARRSGIGKWTWTLLAATAAAVPLAGLGWLAIELHPGRLTPAIITAVDAATGRQLTFGAPVSLNLLSLTPTLEARDVRLSNPPGVPGAFLTLDRVDAKIALLPLLSRRIDILQLVLIGPKIDMSVLPDGSATWDFSAAPHGNTRRAAAGSRYFSAALKNIEIRNGELSFHLTPQGAPLTLAVAHATGKADALTAPLHIHADAALGNAPLTIDGVVGPVASFLQPDAGPWPVNFTLALTGATASVTGAIDDLRTGGGGNFAVAATIPNLAVLGAALAPGATHVPPIQGLHVAAQIEDDGAALPSVNALSVTAGASDLSAVIPHLALTSLTLNMASLNDPVTATATGTLGTAPVTVQGNAGAIAGLLSPPSGTPALGTQGFPVMLSLQVADAKATVQGGISTPQTLSGAALAFTASVPDLAALGQDAGMALPAWKNLALQSTLIDPGGQGLASAIGLEGLTLTMDNASLGADASVYFAPSPRLTLALTISQANIDALLAAIPAGTALPPLPVVATLLPWIKTGNADVLLTADTLTVADGTYSALQAHAQVAGGVLTITPVSGQLPGGRFSASATIDTRTDPAAETLALSAPALAVSPFMPAFGLPRSAATGIAQIQANLSSHGDNQADITSNLTGQIGSASVDDSLSATVLHNLPVPQPATDPLPIRCTALRLDVANGVGTLNALLLASTPLTLSGGGTIDLVHNQLAVTVVPLPQGGAPAPAFTVGGTLGTAKIGTEADTLPLPAHLAADPCPAALLRARLGHAGPAAPPPSGTKVTTSHAPTTETPQNLMNSLLAP